MWDGSQCESGALRTSGAKVSGRCRNDGSVLTSHAEECRPDSDITCGGMSSRLRPRRALSKRRQRIGAEPLCSPRLPAPEWGSPGSGKIQSVSLTPRCFARESCMLQYQIIACADHCAFAWPFVHLTLTNGLQSIGYYNSDFTGDRKFSRSTYSYIFKFAGGPINWKSKRATTVALSTLEAETDVFTEGIREVS